ncbi:hypothetical protein [Nonomuraea jabiensis]|uniref:hypothetical protein n=1 Tax=Nonomuraea jabiensis TaxID=882448 RepID=UPI0036A0AE36
MIGGFTAGFVGSGLSALLSSLGALSFAQIAGLVGSFALETGLIFLAITKAGRRRSYDHVVDPLRGRAHFVPMGLAHGPLADLATEYSVGRSGWRLAACPAGPDAGSR